MQCYDGDICCAVALECLADHVGDLVSLDTYRIKQGTAQTHAVGAVVAAAPLCGSALCLEAPDAACEVYGVQEILAVADGYVDGVAGAQGEEAGQPGRDTDCAVAAEGYVGPAVMFQKLYHGAKVLGFGCHVVLSLEWREGHGLGQV